MAFFGLTALGPQNTFATLSTTFRYIQIFDEADFSAAWTHVNGSGAPNCHTSKLPHIFSVLFHGPTPLHDREPIQRAFDSLILDTPDVIDFELFLKVMKRLRVEAEQESKQLEIALKPTCEYNSTSEMALAMKKNAAMKKELQQKITAPLTTTHEVSVSGHLRSSIVAHIVLNVCIRIDFQYGWSKQDLRRPVAGRSGSEITKFQAELIKNGIYY